MRALPLSINQRLTVAAQQALDDVRRVMNVPDPKAVFVVATRYQCSPGCEEPLTVQPDHDIFKIMDRPEDPRFDPGIVVQHGERKEARFSYPHPWVDDRFVPALEQWLERVHAYERGHS